MEMIAATNNNYKLEEIRQILGEVGYEVFSLKDIGLNIEIEETGATFKENALIKAREICKLTNQISIADDSGLEVEVLGGKPGVHSARYAGIDGDGKDSANNKKLLEVMKDIPEGNRKARFCSVIAIVFPEGREITAKGYIKGNIGFHGVGENGFGYDPLFIIEGRDKTMAQLEAEEKNRISHRANALEKIKDKLLLEKLI